MRKQPCPRLLGALTFTIGSAFATACAFAATHFPSGTYAAEGKTFTATFDDAGHVQVRMGSVLEVEASYAFKGEQLELTDNSGPWACTKPAEKTGTYHWKYANGMLTFSTIDDKCKERAGSLVGQPWKKQ